MDTIKKKLENMLEEKTHFMSLCYLTLGPEGGLRMARNLFFKGSYNDFMVYDLMSGSYIPPHSEWYLDNHLCEYVFKGIVKRNNISLMEFAYSNTPKVYFAYDCVFLNIHNTIYKLEFNNNSSLQSVVQYLSIPDFVMSYPELLVMDIELVVQSGIEHDNINIDSKYSMSKYASRKQNCAKTTKRIDKTAEELYKINLGSKKRKTKRNFEKKKKTQHYGINQQAGIENSTVKNVIMYIEKFVGLYLMKYNDKPIYLGLSALLVLFNGSITDYGISIIKSLLSDVKTVDGTLGDFVNWLKSMLNNVTTFKNNKYAKSFLTFIGKSFSTLLSPSICSYFTRESENAMIKKFYSFIDEESNPLEFILNCITYITSAVDVFIKTGTLDGFINTETTTDSLLLELRDFREKYTLYLTGDLEFVMNFQHYVFQKDLTDFRRKLYDFRKSRKGAELRQIEEWLKEVDKMGVEVERIECHKTARMQPYHIILTSGSGISKSYLSKLLVSAVAIANNIPFGPAYTYYLNQSNEFQSGWLNFFTCVIGDDTAALHADKLGKGMNLADWRLRSSNNQPHELLGAAIHEKGTLFNRSLIELWNSNSFLQDYHALVKNVAAVNRRSQVRISARVRPQYTKDVTTPGTKSSIIDYDKIPEKERDTVAPDAWVFDVYECELQDVPIPVKTEFGTAKPEHDSDFRFVICKNEFEEPMKSVDIHKLLEFLTWHSKNFYAKQKKVLEMDRKVYDSKLYCKHGIPNQYKCSLCKRDIFTTVKLSDIKAKKSKLYKVGFDKSRRCKHTIPKHKYSDQELFTLEHKRYILRGITKYIPGVSFNYTKEELTKTLKRYAFRDKDKGVRYEYIKTTKYSKTIKMDNYCKGLLNFDLGILLQAGKEVQRVTYMAKLLEAIREKRVLDIFSRITDLSNFASECKVLIKELIVTLQTWFDELVCDVIEHFLVKFVNIVADFISNPTHYIPTYMEDTVVSAYCYAKHPVLKIPLTLDYMSYVTKCNTLKLFEPELVRTVVPEYTLTELVYDKFIRSKTYDQKLQLKLNNPISPTEFFIKGGFKISQKEKIIKETDPNFLRDMIIPSIGAGLLVSKFIPNFCKSFAKLYMSTQVGYEVNVEQIAQLDKLDKDKWYLRRQEIMCTPPDTLVKLPYGELENLVVRNTFYFKNMRTDRFCSALSVCNKYLIFPYHFVQESEKDLIQGVKVEIDDISKPGNALIQFTMYEKNVYKLQGDCCIVYVEQQMDHMRTKNLLSYIPNTPSKDTMSGRVYAKSTLGKLSTVDAKEINFSESCNNEGLKFGESAKNPFSGYFYKGYNYEGLCGGVLLDHYHKASQILGIHVGGNPHTMASVACCLYRDEINNAISHFEPTGIIIQTGFHTEKFGKSIHIPEIYKKNPFLDTVDKINGVELLGTVPERITPEAKIVQTAISDDVRKLFNTKVYWDAPPFKYGGDKRYGVRKLIKTFASKNVLRHPEILDKAVEDYKRSIMTPFNDKRDYWCKEIRILNDFEVVNGVVGKRYLSGMKMSTKASSHLKGNKSEYATLVDGVWYVDKIISDEYNRILGNMKKGIWNCDMVIQMLKNEATPSHKIEAGKVRSFYTSCIIVQMIIRRYLLTTNRYFCLNTPYTETTVGINPHGKDWDYFCKEVFSFRKKMGLIALDFKNFDLTSIFEILSEAIDVLFLPLRSTGTLTIEDECVLKCIKHSLLYTIVDASGDLVCLHGIIPSGTPITSILGSIVNSLNYRMAYYFHYPNSKQLFRDVVLLRTYGDDSVANADRSYGKMSVRGILSAFKEIGIQGTDLSKGEVSNVLYYTQDQLEFLKRKMVYDKVFGAYIAPLEITSMLKCLCAHIPPKSMSLDAITGQCIDNFGYEAKFHGKKFYDKYFPKVIEIAKKHGLERFILTLNMSFEDHVTTWREQNADLEQITKRDHKDRIVAFRHFMSEKFDLNTWFGGTQNSGENKEIKDQNQSVVKLVDVLEGTQIYKQAGIEKEEVMSFMEVHDPNSLSIGSAMPTPRVTDRDASLGEFLSRPVKIAEYSWGNTVFHQTLDPWVSLWENKRISNRLSNYTLFRGKCHVKFVINGNGFFYGKLMATYLPFSSIDTFVEKSNSGFDRIPASQLPKIFLDPTLSEGGEMVLPFFYPADYVNLTANNSKRSLGELIIHQIAGLKHANQNIVASLNTVSISVFAWFEDVELQGPTHVNATGIVAQSGREKEDVKKPISQACTAIASASRSLSKIPVITPYALAIEQGAKIASKVASSLGYCRPSNVVEPQRISPRITDNLAVCNSTDNTNKLSVDVKQDLSIDSRICGLDGMDELSIARIAGVDSFLTTFLWGESRAPEDLIYSMYVTPMLFYKSVLPANIYMTAVCGAAMPFNYWTGSIEFHFQVISSSFHRGRLAIVYDPTPYNTATVSREDNVAYTHIVDISETRDFSLSIGNYQETQWLRIEDTWHTIPCFNTTGLTSNLPWTNGVINVYVLNELTTPASDPALNNDINIAVYAKAGPDFKVANPSDRVTSVGIRAQSGLEKPDAIGSDLEETSEAHVNPIQDRELRSYMGEEIESFRTLLKRYNGYMMFQDSGPFRYLYMVHQAYPYFRDYAQDVPYFASNLVSGTMLTYLMRAFAGWRGGIRWKIIVDANNQTNTQTVQVSRFHATTIGNFATSTQAGGTPVINSGNWDSIVSPGTKMGSVLTNTDINPLVEFECPFYSNYKFIAGKPRDFSTAQDPYCLEGFRCNVMRSASGLTDDISLQCYVAGAEDFNLLFFTGFQPFSFT